MPLSNPMSLKNEEERKELYLGEAIFQVGVCLAQLHDPDPLRHRAFNRIPYQGNLCCLFCWIKFLMPKATSSQKRKRNNSDVVLVLKFIYSKQKLSSFVGFGGQRWDAKRKTQTEDTQHDNRRNPCQRKQTLTNVQGWTCKSQNTCWEPARCATHIQNSNLIDYLRFKVCTPVELKYRKS